MMKPRSVLKTPKSPSPPQPLLPTNISLPPREPRSPVSPGKPLTMKRISALYYQLKTRDAKSRYPWRTFVLVLMVFASLFIFQFLTSGLLTLLPTVEVGMPGSGIYQRYDEIFYNISDFAYIPDSKIFMTTTAKAGSTTFWAWLHRGITGLPSFDRCNYTYIQNFEAPCWNNKVIHPHKMSNSERWHMLNDRSVLRIAITRDPFERLISSWKSKAACDSDDFGTDVEDRNKMIPILLQQAGLQKHATCLSLPSFAEALDRLRIKEGKGEFHFKNLDKHFRPQECHFNEISYDIIIDVKDLTNVTVLRPIVKRLKHPYLMTEPPKLLHASLKPGQTMSDATAAALYRFASLTERFPHKRFLGKEMYR